MTVTTAQVAYDLAAAGRPAVALAYLAARADGTGPATWLLRVDLLRKLGRRKEAEALLAAAATRPIGVPPAAIIATGYALDRPDLIIAAAASGAIPPPDAKLAHDLAQRAEARGRLDWLAQLDRAGVPIGARAIPGWRCGSRSGRGTAPRCCARSAVCLPKSGRTRGRPG
ncbi:hypothetical protein [Sphingomonas paucimobilis]|uniref:Uncharacterized protein n=1 Tax=Sphingomonas paucimobilis TaxID=13689 RepID=A0A7T3ABN6_SPHPI|nr:hypothetical protein [Sphingomonas paucimobilis]QPT09736.1 hypothetical protein I6G38_05650 [Sphingomonas paucimobilis]